jgi:tetratricopeptide (TPR) repeat protein
MGKPGDAIESFRNAMRVEPYRAGPRRELARLLDQARVDPAQATLRERFRPDVDEIRKLRAQEVDLLTRDATLLPGDARPHYDRGMLLYLLDRVDDAREAFEEACRLAPDDYNAWMALALIAERQQRWKDAERALRNMQRLRPDAEEWKGMGQRMVETIRKLEADAAATTPHSESLSPDQAEGVADEPEPGEN